MRESFLIAMDEFQAEGRGGGVLEDQRGDKLRFWVRTHPPSPRIISIVWGEIEVAGCGKVKDAKLFPGGARQWDWSETGTRHSPGIQPADVQEALDAGATVVVLSRGMDLVLRVMPETLRYLSERGIDVHVAESRAATRLYNELAAAGHRVAALIHSTC